MADTSFDTDFLDSFCGEVAEGDDATIASCMIYNVSGTIKIESTTVCILFELLSNMNVLFLIFDFL